MDAYEAANSIEEQAMTRVREIYTAALRRALGTGLAGVFILAGALIGALIHILILVIGHDVFLSLFSDIQRNRMLRIRQFIPFSAAGGQPGKAYIFSQRRVGSSA